MTARTFVRGSLALALAFSPTWCFAARPTAKSASSNYQPEGKPADLFDAIDDGLVEVKFIPKNEKQARVRIKNLSGKPLSVRLPEAFGARQVLAQVGGPFAGGPFGAGAAGGQSGGAQNLGANFGGANNQNRVFNVPADKPAELRVTCVCLEYGKPTPRPAISYEMVRLDAVSQEPSLAGLLSRLEGSNQREVQAAAWHLANGMSWSKLAAVHVEHLVALNEPLFTARDLQKAKELVRDATAGAEGGARDRSPVRRSPLACRKRSYQ
ncbi:MAG TPA: hypothetical protein VG125_23820 [Pirellulales bacterium]|jgi:hypothetical protein|nr:hypothetical protein [Pirellulales bacterium]